MASDQTHLEETYRQLSNENLLRIAALAEDLTDEAMHALSEELTRRKLTEKEIAPYREEQQKIQAARNMHSENLSWTIRLLFGPLAGSLFESFRDIARGKK